MNNQNKQRYCRKCLDDIYTMEKLNKTIQEYIDSLDESQKVGDDIYQERLSLCKSCDRLMGITCSLCGCFVEVRAIKNITHCPDPENKKW